MRRPPGSPDARQFIIVMIITDVVNTVSPGDRAQHLATHERRGFRLAAWMWQSRFAGGFFRLASLGGRRFKSQPGHRASRAARVLALPT